MNLTRNFTLSELTKSDTAIRMDINNNPSAEQIEKLKALCENILQPVRDHFGRVKITSGFRSTQLCIAINSSANSQHAKAEAADFECPGVDNAELFDWIKLNLQLGLDNQTQACLVKHHHHR
jgi:zinc D-Ala-D-Ala carboxypeptidase